LVPLQEFFIEKVAVKLYGDFFYLLAFTLVHEPGVLKVWSNQHEFYIIDLFDMIANHTFGAFCILNKIQLERIMVMKWEIELLFKPIAESEAVALHERNYI